MAKNGGVKRRREGQKAKNGTPRRDDHESKDKKRGWSDVFHNVTYSSGPEENVYVFG